MQLTTVITNSGRPAQLWRAFSSCLEAGVPNIVVVSSPVPPEVKLVHARMRRAFPAVKIICLPSDPGCNAAWMRGVKSASTKWVHILHDDDVIAPGALNGLDRILESDISFVLFDSAAHNAQNTKQLEYVNKYVDTWTKESGLYACASLRAKLLSDTLSLSPVSGVFRKEHLVDVLHEFQTRCAGKKEFTYRAKMDVGNDLLIWLRATELPGRFYYCKQILVSYGSWSGSTTCSDIAGKNKLPAIYDDMKKYWRSNRQTNIDASGVASFCYVPSLKKFEAFAAHVVLFERKIPFVFVTDAEGVFPKDVVRIPKIGPFTKSVGLCRPSDQYAFIAFLRTIEIAEANGLEYFLLVETDCRFSVNNWDAIMWEEFQKWPGALFGGTPVCWHPWARGYRDSMAIVEYAYRYQKASGVAMAFEGEHSSPFGTAIYPNGALAIYSVKECLEYFAEPMKWMNGPVSDQEKVVSLHAFDLHVGRMLVRKYGVAGALKRLAYLPSSYSGCGDHHVALTDRVGMINSKRKVAVHQVKSASLDQ